MSNAEPKNLPTYRIYSVMKNGDKNAVWTEIGAAFEHKDGKGFGLVFTARPLDGAQIVLRTPKCKPEQSSRQTTGRYGVFHGFVRTEVHLIWPGRIDRDGSGWHQQKWYDHGVLH